MKDKGTQKFSIFKYKKIIMLALILVAIAVIVTAAYITDYSANTVSREDVLTMEPKGEYRSNEDFFKNFKTFEITLDYNKGLITPHTDSNGNLVAGYYRFRITSELAEKTNLKNNVTVYGGLGANWIGFISNTGKTTFTQFVFKALGVKEVVNSPTFAILKTYQSKFKLHHFDTYRITTEEAIEAGFDEVLNEKDSIKFIEWSENVASLLPNKTISVNIKYISENEREFEIE
jgi:tRNA threonylcarbamoyl adenosine modification protein YjeE